MIRKVIIAGSRTVSPGPFDIDRALAKLAGSGLLWHPSEWTHIVCGMARGADLSGMAWAGLHNKTVIECPVTLDEYAKYGRHGGPRMRNRRMADIADAAIVFWDGVSGGSADMVCRMVARDKPVAVIPWRAPVVYGPHRKRSGAGQSVSDS